MLCQLGLQVCVIRGLSFRIEQAAPRGGQFVEESLRFFHMGAIDNLLQKFHVPASHRIDDLGIRFKAFNTQQAIMIGRLIFG